MLTEEEYAPIRAALFDAPPGQGAAAARLRLAEHLAAAGFELVPTMERRSFRDWRVVGEDGGIFYSRSDREDSPDRAEASAQEWLERLNCPSRPCHLEVWRCTYALGPTTWESESA